MCVFNRGWFDAASVMGGGKVALSTALLVLLLNGCGTSTPDAGRDAQSDGAAAAASSSNPNAGQPESSADEAASTTKQELATPKQPPSTPKEEPTTPKEPLPSTAVGDAESNAKPAAPAGAPPAGGKAPPSEKPLNVVVWFKEFGTDRAGAFEKYVGKTITVAGKVKRVGRGISEGKFRPEIELAASEFVPVYCIPVDTEPWARIAPGQQITITGTMSDNPLVTLVDCKILAADAEHAAARVTADELAEAAAAGEEALKQKYPSNSLIVEGEIADVNELSLLEGRLELKGSGKVKIECKIDSTFKPYWSMLKNGDRVRLFATRGSVRDGEVVLLNCMPITSQE